MKFTTTILSVAALAVTTVTADPMSAMSTLTVHPACPSTTPSDEMVTRSAVMVPSCAAGNETKPMIISVSGDKTMTMPAGGPMMTPSMSASGNPAQFTGAAAKKSVVGGVVALGGVIAAFVV